MNNIPRSEGIQIAANAAKRHGAPMCVVVTIDPTTTAGVTIRVDSWGCNRAVCAITADLANHLYNAVATWEAKPADELIGKTKEAQS